jgi:hypothetical protein
MALKLPWSNRGLATDGPESDSRWSELAPGLFVIVALFAGISCCAAGGQTVRPLWPHRAHPLTPVFRQGFFHVWFEVDYCE